jgi:hypothetical protein
MLIEDHLHREEKPIPLPENRERALTPPLLPRRPKTRSNPHYVEQRTVAQFESALLTKLPAEIRRRIWEMAIGGMRLHIVRKYKRLGHTVCSMSDETCDCDSISQELHRAAEVLADWNMLALLTTCRQIHAISLGLVRVS